MKIEQGIENLSFGCELEWSDIDRRVDIPEYWGSWEGPKIAGYAMGSEIDIVNTKGQWRGHGTDPLCINCKVGGEIHTCPSETIDSQMYRIMKIMNLFSTVCVACPNHGHIHVGIPGIKHNLEALKNLFRYTQLNEVDLIMNCCGYTSSEHSEIVNSGLPGWITDYLIVGDGKSINPEIYSEVEEASSVQEVLQILEDVNAVNYDWVQDKSTPAGDSHRTACNLYNLTKGETIEFRIFRASVNPVEIYSSLMMAKRYTEEALKGADGKPVSEILKEGAFKFAKLNFNYELAKSWGYTRETKGRCGCFKHYTGTMEVSEDPLTAACIESDSTSPFEKGLQQILNLCKLDFQGKTISYLY